MYDWGLAGDPVKVVKLLGHTLDVKDISWHEQDTNLLAACAQDQAITVWDCRAPGQPTVRIASNSGVVTQVCWERISGRTFASSHNQTIRLWDLRQPRDPIRYFASPGKGSAIAAMDFSTVRAGDLVSSQDKFVKFWDTTEETGTDWNTKPRLELVNPLSVIKMRWTSQ